MIILCVLLLLLILALLVWITVQSREILYLQLMKNVADQALTRAVRQRDKVMELLEKEREQWKQHT